MTVGSGPSREDAAAQSGQNSSANAGDQTLESTSASESPRSWRRTSAWPWPAVAVTAVALAGYLFGTLGALLVAGQTVATLLFVAGDYPPNRSRRSWLTVSAVAAGILVIAGLFWQAHSMGLLPKEQSRPASGPVDLAGSTVTESILKGIDLRGADLSGANFDGLSLIHLSLAGAMAPGASFVGTNLRGVSMQGADLRGANFSMACLRGSDLDGANLTGADITGADITGTNFPPNARKTLVGKAAPKEVKIPSCE